jgi:Tol biopolymer transport system component
VDDVRDRVIRELERITPAPDGLGRTLERARNRRRRRRLSAGVFGVTLTIILGAGLTTVALNRQHVPNYGTGPAPETIVRSGALVYGVSRGSRTVLYVTVQGHTMALGPVSPNFLGGRSPDGTKVVFSRPLGEGGVGMGVLLIRDVNSGKTHVIVSRRNFSFDGATWSPDGQHILFTTSSTQPFLVDPDGSHMHALLSKPADCAFSGSWLPDSSGIVSVFACYPRKATWLNRVEIDRLDGTRTTILGPTKMIPDVGPVDPTALDYEGPVMSPDGSRIVLAIRSGTGDRGLYVVNADGTDLHRIAGGRDNPFNPIWSPDGTQIAFLGAFPGGPELFVMNADGSGIFRIHLRHLPMGISGPLWLSAPPSLPSG